MFRALFALPALALAACVNEPVVDGAMLYQEQCSACHGVNGKGSGDIADTLSKTPPDLTKIAARNGGTFDRDAVMSTIDGLHHSEDNPMPEFGAGDMGAIIMVGRTPVPVELLALASYLETIQE